MMKTFRLLLLSFFLLIFQASKAQNFQLRSTLMPVYPQMNFLGKDHRHYYFKTSEKQVTRFAIGNPSDRKDLIFSPGKDDLGSPVLYFHEGHLFVISTETSRDEKNKTKTQAYRFYKLDPADGQIISNARFDLSDSLNRYYSSKLDTLSRHLMVYKGDSVYASFDYSLRPGQITRPGKSKSRPVPMTDLQRTLTELLSAAGLNVSVSIGNLNLLSDIGAQAPYSDSVSMDDYRISYEKRKDKDIYYFGSVIQNIVIGSKRADNKVKNVELSLDLEKSVLDLHYRQDLQGTLYVMGKYMVKGKSSNEYGMFSVIYDRELMQKTAIKYFDLSVIPVFEKSVPNVKYAGFIFSRLSSADYEFDMEEGTCVYTYQQSYSNLQDHIYLLKMEANGEITTHLIANRLEQDTKSGRNEKHIALRVGNQIHIVFFGHEDDLGREIRDYEYSNSNIYDKRCVWMSCTYRVSEDEFTKKTLLAPHKTFKQFPAVNSAVLHFDPVLQQHICLFRAYDRKLRTVGFFELLYTE